MKKFAITLIVGITLLAAASVAQAHSGCYGGYRGALSLAVPVGHHGYAVLGTAPYYYPGRYYYPAPYVRRGYVRGYRNGYPHGNKHGKKHGRHHDDYRYYDDHRRDRRGHH